MKLVERVLLKGIRSLEGLRIVYRAVGGEDVVRDEQTGVRFVSPPPTRPDPNGAATLLPHILCDSSEFSRPEVAARKVGRLLSADDADAA